MYINACKYMYIHMYINIYIAMLTLHAFDPHGIMTRARSIHLPPQRI